jgi:hypothetical protein
MLQDTMKEFFVAASVGARGTTYNIKELFNHRNLKEKVMDNFQHVWDFIQVIIINFPFTFI